MVAAMSPNPATTRVAIVGCAHRPHALSYGFSLNNLAESELIGVFDEDPEIAASVAQRLGVPAFPSVDELLAGGGTGPADAAIVCGATADHRRHVEQAAAAGCHVLCEKPLATTIDDAHAIIEACDAAGVQLHTAFVCRFYPSVLRLRQMVAAGELGELFGMTGANRGPAPLPPMYPAWITDPVQAGGGALFDHSVHVVDAMRFVSGREVTAAYAEVDRRFAGELAVDDTAVLSVRFDDGAIGTVDPSWSVPSGNPWSYDFQLQVVGSEGSARIDDRHETIGLVTRDGGERWVGIGQDIDADMIAAFVQSVRDGQHHPVSATGADGLRALQVAIAGYRAAAATQWQPVG